MKRCSQIFPVILIVAVAACSSGSNGATAPAPLACVTNNTAEVDFSNESVTNRTYDILVDGSRVASVSPGTTSPYINVVAGIPHSIEFNVSNSSTAACTPAAATLVQCSTSNYFCRG
jgi:hypothetical protein